MKAVAITAAPHTHDASSVERIMLTVVLSLVPATTAGLYLFGWPAANLLVVTVLSALLFEAIALSMRGKSVVPRLADGSAVVAAWLLALSLPPHAPWWIGVVGALIAIALGKQAFGGIGQNVFNPAMLARVVLLLAFPVEMTSWPEPLHPSQLSPAFGLSVSFLQQVPDGLSGATWLAQDHQIAFPLDLSRLLLGVRGGSMGESSLFALSLGGVLLLAQRIITWHVPVAVIAGIALPALALGPLTVGLSPGPLSEVCSGGLLLTALFIATDPTTSPSSSGGKIVFGLGVGALIFVIRNLCSLPEGAAFAVLTMNALVPILDRKLRPRIYGRNRQGAPLATGAHS